MKFEKGFNLDNIVMNRQTMQKFKQTEIGMIPEDWGVKKISDLFNVFAGGDLSKLTFSKNKDKDYKYPIYSNSLNDKGLYGFSKTYQYEPECITVTGRGDVGRAECRREPFNAIVRLLVLKPKEKLSCYFIASFINSRLDFQIVGSAVNQLTAPMISEFVVAFPPLPEQRAIAKILSDLDTKIELDQQMNKTLEEIGKAIFKHWFVDFEFPNDEGKPYKSSGGEMVFNEELGKEIPKGWRVGKYEDLVDVSTGKGLKREDFAENGEYAVLGANGKLGRTNNFLFDEKLILTGRVGTLGTVYLIRDKIWISDNVLISKPKSDENYYYAYFTIKLFDFNSLNRGSTQPLITQTDLKNQIVLIPNNDLLSIFHKICLSLFDKIYQNESDNISLSQIRDSLLPKLMSGKIRVPIEDKS